VLAVVAAFLLLAGNGPKGSGPAAHAAPSQPKVQGDLVSFAAADFADGKARFYQYPAPGGITVRYFILQSSDGLIRAAFDACDVCWPANKGYRQEGDEMICNNCGRHFPSVRINEVKGGCNPAPLKRRVAGGRVFIRVADILEGSRYFNFKENGS
jgi:uncharacterized membrane protein